MRTRSWVLAVVVLGVLYANKARLLRMLRRAKYSSAEWETRVQLAALYRLAAKLGLDELIYNHITARVPNQDALLINGFGLRHDEITASNLVKINLKGEIIDAGSAGNARVNLAGLVIHSAVHEARHDLGCVLHHHDKSSVGVASAKCGFVVTSQQAAIVKPYVSEARHEYEGIAVEDPEKQRLKENLGDKQILLMKNHGALVCGKTIPEAFVLTWTFDMACKQQAHHMAMVGGDMDKIEAVSEGVVADTAKRLQRFRENTKSPAWELDFAAALRTLSSPEDQTYSM
eukprot:TRINITY_DN17723_c0_g1_i2.p1 TRINITY_DN17723_c0_g1~~TRINITY_DN17723_c0_g1_i2.p1  ORF type:complete len:287 (+),score=141.12 TRINITY_DN17723_c0_g1_i2:60-920(+)